MPTSPAMSLIPTAKLAVKYQTCTYPGFRTLERSNPYNLFRHRNFHSAERRHCIILQLTLTWYGLSAWRHRDLIQPGRLGGDRITPSHCRADHRNWCQWIQWYLQPTFLQQFIYPGKDMFNVWLIPFGNLCREGNLTKDRDCPVFIDLPRWRHTSFRRGSIPIIFFPSSNPFNYYSSSKSTSLMEPFPCIASQCF